MLNSFAGIYHGKRVLVTGHTGFKGGWMSVWLHALGAKVSGYALPCPEGDSFSAILDPGMFEHSALADIRDAGRLAACLEAAPPDVIFHLAAQPIVGISYRSPLDTFTTNTLGTAILLEAVRKAGCGAAVVVVTSDKCYRNMGPDRPFAEDAPLGGSDVYSMSKAAAELVVASWHASFFSRDPHLGPLATARGGNAIGGGDYGEDRLVPDLVRSAIRGVPMLLRRPHATRPWQHVLELVAGYLALGQRLLSRADTACVLSYNFGPGPEAEKSVRDLVDSWLREWPDSLCVAVASQPAYAEADGISLDASRAKAELGWKPVWTFYDAVRETSRWYQARHHGGAGPAAMLHLSREQIHQYTAHARSQSVGWAGS